MSIEIIPLLKKLLKKILKRFRYSHKILVRWQVFRYSALLESILIREDKKKKPDRTKYYADIIIVLDKVQEYVNCIYGEDN